MMNGFCNSLVAGCTLGAWMADYLPTIAAGVSIMWFSIQISWFIYKRFKSWRAKK